ncbi:MAG: HD domain-containing phosphohydrolase [Vicinamibacterales bacterium]
MNGAAVDGNGAGDLPLSARILCIADICDALRASRPYRAGLPIERVLDIMKRDVGTGIDPDCFQALEHVLDRTPALSGAEAPAVQVVPALSEDYEQAA